MEYEPTGEYRKPLAHEWFASWSHIDHRGQQFPLGSKPVIQAGSLGVSSDRIIMREAPIHIHEFVCECGVQDIPW
jgi:hypothetical protein